MPAIVPIVEGFAEVESIPILFRRILAHQNVPDVSVARPFRVQRNRVVRPQELERAVTLAISDRAEAAGVIVVLDSDDDCPARLGPALLARARKVTSLPAAIVLAHREFECWFLGAKESLRGKRGIRNDSAAPEDPEAIRGAKERLSRNMPPGRRYLKVDDQPAFADAMNLEQTQACCPSFARLMRALNKLAHDIRANRK